MAHTRIRSSKSRISQRFKSDGSLYTCGLNCCEITAEQRMELTRIRWAKNDGIRIYNAYQTFAPYDNVTPELAHQIGIALAEGLWGERFEVLIFTYLTDTHCYNRFVLNAVSFVDGKRYYDCKITYADMRRLSDALCELNGLSVVC